MDAQSDKNYTSPGSWIDEGNHAAPAVNINRRKTMNNISQQENAKNTEDSELEIVATSRSLGGLYPIVKSYDILSEDTKPNEEKIFDQQKPFNFSIGYVLTSFYQSVEKEIAPPIDKLYDISGK